ncbi:MAG: hypothetical protein ACLTC8_02105 [Lachnospiraceae bacterium]
MDAKVYRGDAGRTLHLRETTERIASDGTFADFTMDTIRPEQLHTKTETIDSTMFHRYGFYPTAKRPCRLCNGQRTRPDLVVADIPIDRNVYICSVRCPAAAIPIFALLAWSAFFTATLPLVMTTLLLSLLSIGVYCHECRFYPPERYRGK